MGVSRIYKISVCKKKFYKIKPYAENWFWKENFVLVIYIGTRVLNKFEVNKFI